MKCDKCKQDKPIFKTHKYTGKRKGKSKNYCTSCTIKSKLKWKAYK